MACECTILAPIKNRNDSWIVQNVLDLHDAKTMGMAWDDFIYSDGDTDPEYEMKFPWAGVRSSDQIKTERLWGPPPDKDAINCQKAAVYGWSRRCYRGVFLETPFHETFVKGLFVNRRYYAAVLDYLHDQELECVEFWEMSDHEGSAEKPRFNSIPVAHNPLASLAQVGSKIALSFAFTFLRRAWRMNEDSELCTDLLEDTLLAFRALPPGSMYDTSNISETWLSIMEKSKEFLKTVALGDLTPKSQGATKLHGGCIPIADQHLAVNLLLEFVLQTAKLSNILEILHFLLDMWEERKQLPDTRKNPKLTSAPVLHFVKQMKQLARSNIASYHAESYTSQHNVKLEDAVDYYLNSLHFPTEEDVCINYQQAVVVALSFLNRTARSLQNPGPKNKPRSDSSNIFEKSFSRMAVYKIFRYSRYGEIACFPELSDIKFEQIVCGKVFNAAISSDESLYIFGNFESWSEEGVKHCRNDLPLHVKIFGKSDVKFAKLAMNSESSYFLALSISGEVYFCGSVKDAPFQVKSDTTFFERPEKIDKQNPFGKRAVDIACGREYIVIVAEDGECYSWYEAEKGPLDTHYHQKDLLDNPITKFSTSPVDTTAVALSMDSELTYLIVESQGILSWDGAMDITVPTCSEHGQPKICKVCAGCNFVAAISDNGDFHVWGTGIGGLVESTEHEIDPTQVKSVKRVKDMVSTSDRVLVLDERGDIYSWKYGSMDGLTRVNEFADKKIYGIAARHDDFFVWGVDDSFTSKLPENLPFVLQPDQETLSLLDQFLTKLCTNLDTVQAPNQERECMLISVVNLLHLQLQESALRREFRDGLLDTMSRWPCLANIKKNITFIASTPGITASIRTAAQECLRVGWEILLPSVKERAGSLALVLESANKSEKVHGSQEFLINLLIESLTEDCALEKLLRQEAICETASFELEQEDDESCPRSEDSQQVAGRVIGLIGQILKKVCRETINRLRNDMDEEDFYSDLHKVKLLKPKEKVSDQHTLRFLLKFLTVVTAYVLDVKNKIMPGYSRLLKKCMLVLCEHVMTILKTVSSIVADFALGEVSEEEKIKKFVQVSETINKDAGCLMLHPLITSLMLSNLEMEQNPVFYDSSNFGNLSDFLCIQELARLLKALDWFNSFAPGCNKEEESVTEWLRKDSSSKPEDSLPYIDVRKARRRKQKKHDLDELTCNSKDYVSGLMHTTRSLAIFLSTHLLRYQKHEVAREKLSLLPDSVKCLFKHGLCVKASEHAVDNDTACGFSSLLYDLKHSLAIRKFLLLLPVVDDSQFCRRESEDVETATCGFLRKFEHQCKKFGGFISSGNSETKLWLDKFGRWYLACLLKFLNLADVAFRFAGQKNTSKNAKAPACIIELCKIIATAKLKIVKKHQSTGKSYAEICYPLVERLNFLLTEVTSPPLGVMESQLKDMSKPKSRWKSAVNMIKKRNSKAAVLKTADDNGSSEELMKLKKISKEDKNTKSKNVTDYWGLIYSVITSKSDFENLKRCIDGPSELCDKTSDAMMEFVFDCDIELSVVQETLSCCQSSVQNATRALHEVLEIFRGDFVMPFTSHCLRISWNSMFDELYDCIPARAIEKKKRMDAEFEKRRTNFFNAGKLPCDGPNSDELTATVDQSIPVNPIINLKYKLARKEFGDWVIEKFRSTAIEALSLAKIHEKYPDDASDLASVIKSSMVDQQVLLSKSLSLFVELHSLHFLWNSEESYMSQSILWGCQTIFERILTILSEFGINMFLPETSQGDLADDPKTICAKAKHPDLEAGPKLVGMLGSGVKVVRGKDWKWDDQDGSRHGEGCVVASPEDGWVRVRWAETGIANSYRMGKDEKYDVKLAQPENYCAGHEEGHSCLERIPKSDFMWKKRDPTKSYAYPLMVLKQACSYAMQMQLLTLASSSYVDAGAARIASKRMLSILHPRNNHILIEEFGVDWASFQFVRTLVTNENFCRFFVTRNWIEALQDLIGHDYVSVTRGNLNTQVQGILLYGKLLASTHFGQLNRRKETVLYLLKTVGLLAMGVKSIQTEDGACNISAQLNRNSRLPGLSPFADHAGCIAEHLVQLLRNLHFQNGWQDVINEVLCSGLQNMSVLFNNENLGDVDPTEDGLHLNFGVAAMIGRVDKRLFIGGNTYHDPKRDAFSLGPDSMGKGVVIDIQDNSVQGYFFDEHTQKNTDIKAPAHDHKAWQPNHLFNWELLPWNNELIATCNKLLNIVLISPACISDQKNAIHEDSGAKPKDGNSFRTFQNFQTKRYHFCMFHLYIYLLRSLPVLLQNQQILRTVIKYNPPAPQESTTFEETSQNASSLNVSSDSISLSTSCPLPSTVESRHDHKRCLSESDASSQVHKGNVVILPLDDIEVQSASIVTDYESLGGESDDVTEATEEYQSDDGTESKVPKDFPESMKKSILHELLSLATTPSRVKPSFSTGEIEEAISSLVIFLESSSEQQSILEQYLEKLDIKNTVLESSSKYVKSLPSSNLKSPKCGQISRRNRSKRRARQIEHVKANESLHDNSMRYRHQQRLRRYDRTPKNSTRPRVPRFSSFMPITAAGEPNNQTMESLIPADSMQTLKDMGFKDKHIFAAYEELNKSPLFATQRNLIEGGYALDVEIVIAWLLENPLATIEGLDSARSDDDDDMDGFTIIENDMFGRSEHLVPEDVFHTFCNNNKTSSSSDSESTEGEDSQIDFSIPSPRMIHHRSTLQRSFDLSRDEDTAASVMTEFLTPEDFANPNEYASYIRDHIKVGMLVKCCKSYEDVKEGDTGRVLKLDHDGLNDLNVHAAWATKGGTYWVRYVHVQLIRDESFPLPEDKLHLMLSPIAVGDMVRVKPSVVTPKYKWGLVNHESVGRLINIDDRDAVVDFKEQQHWTGLLSELEKVPEPHPRISCDQCQTTPIIGPRYKCTVCADYDMCSMCFGKKCHASSRHVFDMIEKPGAAKVRTTASFPSPEIGRQQLRSKNEQTPQDVAFCPANDGPPRFDRAYEMDVGEQSGSFLSTGVKFTTLWKKMVDKLEVSSGATSKINLIDGNDKTFWKSCGSHGDHKLTLTMQPGAVVTSLVMQVDPNDSSYMPSLINMTLSDPDKKTVKSRLITIQPTSKFVLLLRDCEKFYQQITIRVEKCHKSGIDCKIHGLLIKGYVLPSSETSLPQSKPEKGIHSYDDIIEELYLAPSTHCKNARYSGTAAKQNTECAKIKTAHTRVYVWGLNDKDQLGGPKGSKIKTPHVSEAMSALKVSQIIGGSKSLFIVTQEGKVFSCGESTNGRLGLGLVSSNVTTPTFISHLTSYFITKVAIHSGGRHAMALTSTGVVFSWGDGEDGKLGHGNRTDCYKPRLITALKDHHIIDIACGGSHSAAVTVTGKLFTWGQGNYGRLGHGDNTTHLKPKLVTALHGVHVIQVACGSRDAQTLCLSKISQVYSWGDGDFGKLGRGGSEGCAIPQLVDKLNGKDIIQIECGAQFSLALSKNGQIWTWGKGDYFRLGHGHDGHVRHPTVIEELKHKKVVKVAVGALHCLAVMDDGSVYAWGDNDHGQQGNSTTAVNRRPGPVDALNGFKITGIACGSSHSIAWSLMDETRGLFEPMRFSVLKDNLGKSYTRDCGFDIRDQIQQPGLLDISGKLYMDKAESKYSDTSEEKNENIALPKIVLALESNDKKKSALTTLLQTQRINFARDLVTYSLIPAKFTKDGRPSHVVSTRHSKTRKDPPADEGTHTDEAQGLSAALNEEAPTTSSGFQSKMSDHAMASLIAETITTPEEITVKTPKKEDVDAAYVGIHKNKKLNYLSDNAIYHEVGPFNAKSLADILKFAIAGRTSIKSYAAVSNTLQYLVKSQPEVIKILLSHATSELEKIANKAESKGFELSPVTEESTHPYSDDCDIFGTVKIPGAESLRLEFDSKCSTETRHDVLTLYTKDQKNILAQLSGREHSDWSHVYNVEGDEVCWTFKSDASVNGWGWKFTVYPVCTIGKVSKENLNEMCDQQLLEKPIISFVSNLIELIVIHGISCDGSKQVIEQLVRTKGDVFHQLVKVLTTCTHAALIEPVVKMWAVQQLQNLCSMFSQLFIKRKVMSSLFKPLISVMPDILFMQYKYEEPSVRTGQQLMHSAYLREFLMLASDMEVENYIRDIDKRVKLAPFSTFFITRKTMDALVNRTVFSPVFLQRVSQKLDDLLKDEICDTTSFQPSHEDNSLFTQEMDEQLVDWMNSSPSNWTRTWGGSGQIFGWGHNHRGQLGGIEGAKIKVPTVCSTLISLQPVSLAGGEQTLYAVTADGKVYATGYGAGGRLGIGSCDSIALPTLLESIRHVHITKVSVNSGGKHILALSLDGEVYSWGDGGEGKLGHGSRKSCDRPCVIESLRGVDIVDICAGGAHSAALSKEGHLYTWGKGRYGRLGHGDSEDRLKPKLVEFLIPYRVLSVACGSGDAQTLCVTDKSRRDSNIQSEGSTVWSWGDGDYGKLGRGGSDMSKIPAEIEGLKDKHIITVKCGSQFSLALSKQGQVYTWGKGDYYRLGHGSDQHVRYPKVVEDLKGKKIVDVSTGSLHCVVCTEDGEVYAWGDNDEGQIGDGTTQAAQRLTVITSLSGQGIDRVACGSAHSMAWSSGSSKSRKRNSQSRLPTSVPIKYNLLQTIPIAVLRNRLVLLNQFSEILCGCIPFLSLMDHTWRSPLCSGTAADLTCNFNTVSTSRRFPDAVRGLLINSGKECFFRKIVQTTMIREKQHGPSIELNRIEIKDIKKAGVPMRGLEFVKSVFYQASCEIGKLLPDSVLLPHRVWKVKFVGESVDDCGGGYSESIAEMCDELENGSAPLLMQTPNGRDEAGANRDCFILSPLDDDCYLMAVTYKFLGILLGIAVRTGSPLSLNLAEPIWKLLSGQEQCLTDISEIDKDFLPKLMFIRDADAEELDSMNLPFTIKSASAKEVSLSKLHTSVDVGNRNEYIRQAIKYRLHEFDLFINLVREGMSTVVPLPLVSLFTANELETMVCGSPDIPLCLLKSVASFKGTAKDENLQQWFWEIMESMTNEEKSLFLRFVWGRSRLPRTIADFRGRDFVIQVLDKYDPPDYYLPESYTCFFLLKLPRYSSKAIMEEKLKYAIYFCKSIDTDDYARLPVDGEDEDEDLEDLIASSNNNMLRSSGFASHHVRQVQEVVDRLRSQVRTTSLSLLSRYSSSNVTRYLGRRSQEPSRLFNRPAFVQDVRPNLESDSFISEPSSQSDSDDDDVLPIVF